MSDEDATWYHGSPFDLTVIRAGSTITRNRNLARVFSHKPTLVSIDIDDNGTLRLKHSGRHAGILYRIAEPIQPGDVYPHPATTLPAGQECLTTRELRVERAESTAIIADEVLTEQEIAELRKRSAKKREGTRR